jgi:asparagine synthase (glutamine-hydrolysing)
MCAIVGVLGEKVIEQRSVETARDTMSHRGPDGAGCWTSPDGRVVLAHRRLAIIDLSPLGDQPMSDSTGRLQIVYNGELYNYRELRHVLEAKGHRFRSNSDTEVLLTAYLEWGEVCLERLDGMFAFGLYDTHARRLFLARDRAGEKPLFYAQVPGRFAFASELKALLALPGAGRRLNPEALEFYLAYGYVPGDRAILDGVRKLAPAHALDLDLETGRTRTWCYWRLPEPSPAAGAGGPELVAELDQLLESSVRRRLVADVPIGILLSGGLDSGLVAAMASRVSAQPVRTFTVSFPGHGSFDEGPTARRLAAHFGTVHTELEGQQPSIELLPHLARQFDEPIADSSMLPTFLVSQLIRQHATVALGGDGGDELFGGYRHYGMLQRHEASRRWIPPSWRDSVARIAATALPVGLRGRSHLIGFTADVGRSLAHINMYFDAAARRCLLRPEARGVSGLPESYKISLSSPDDSLVRRATETDFRSTMVDAYLVKVDRASMLNSLEVRSPFLDANLIEFAFGRVPDWLRATGTECKVLLRSLARRLFPPGIDLRRKQGFSVPLAAWLRGAWGRYVEEILSEADATVFNRQFIASLVASQRRGFSNAQRLFSLTVFELWRREYRVHL